VERNRREYQRCAECGHGEKHLPKAPWMQSYDAGCQALIVAGHWETPHQEPCFCRARSDWDFSDVLRFVRSAWATATARFARTDEVPF
jgi:hypothetical protein